MPAIALCLLIAAPAARASLGDVVLSEKGDVAVLSNGVLTATISKSHARITSLRFRGTEMLRDGYYSMDGGEDYETPAGCLYRVKTSSPDLVDIGMRRIWKKESQAFDVEVHYVLRRGDSGLYSYALLDHPAQYPATGVSEWRFVWKLPKDLLERIYVDSLRNWQMEASSDPFEKTPIKEIIKLTGGVRAGHYDCKYDFNANYHDLGCWGHASDRSKLGAWVVLGSHEYFNDGPTKQDLTAAYGIIHLHFGMNHYNASTTKVAAGQAWRKMYGPFLLYCNHAEKGAYACWADAWARSQRERATWPYAWLTGNPEYPPAAARGAVGGRLVVRDALKPTVSSARAWVGLARPPADGNWQFDSMSYQYWSRADTNGMFLIPDVRPGSYTLFAFTAGAVGEFSRREITVDQGRTNLLGSVLWNVPHRGKRIAWEIGVPDRTAREFRHGSDYFHGYLWSRIPDEFPNPLEYYVGKSRWSNDWNYVQTRYSGHNRWGAVSHAWRIHFTLGEAPAGDATLTLAIASADSERIHVTVNDSRRPLAAVSPSVQGGNAMVREGIHAKYCAEYVTIPAGQLKAGENVIELSLTNPGAFGGHVMYDYLSLEVP
jgi:rhamnogalacturonan endolyase